MSDDITLPQRGFTLIEVLIVIVIMGVVLSLAAPAFRNYSASQKVKTASFDIYATLVFARSEALKRRALVTVTPNGGDWATGWTVTTPAVADPLRRQDALSGVITSGAASIVYRLDGRLDTSTPPPLGVLIVPESAHASIQNRCVRIDSATGLPKTTNITTSSCP